MSIKFDELRRLLKSVETKDLKVYRDSAPSSAKYPYIIYEFVNEQNQKSSNKVFAEMPLYQIAFITKGIETELTTLKSVFKSNRIPYSGFTAAPYDENDDTVTQFITYVRCIQ